MAPRLNHIVTLDPDGSGNFQSVFPGEPDEWIVARDDGGNMRFDRHAGDGLKYRERCVLKDAGHVTMSAYADGYIYTSHGPDVVRFRWAPGKTLTKKDTEVLNVWRGGRSAQISLSPTRRYAVIRTRTGSWGYYVRRRLADILSGRDDTMGVKVKVPRGGDRVEQSFGVVDNSLILGYGHSNERNWLEQWSFVTGKRVDTEDVTAHGTDRVARSEADWHEIEGAPAPLVLSKVGTGSGRRLVVAKWTVETDIQPVPNPA